MKLMTGLRVLVISLLVVAAGTVQPKTILLTDVTQGKWADVLTKLSSVPSTKLVLLDSLAQNDPQTADVQDYTAQAIQDTFNNFNSYIPASQSKLIRIYKKLLNSPLLRAEQKAFLQNTVLATVAPTVQQLPPQAEAVAVSNDVAEVHNTLIQNGVAPADVAVLNTTTVTAPAPQLMTLPPATPLTAQPVALPIAQVERPIPMISVQPVASVAMVKPAATPVTESAVTAITQNTQMTTAGKAAALTNLINTTSAPVDAATSTAIAQAIQDLYNAHSSADIAHVVGLLNAAIQKPVLTAEQSNYVKSTLMPVATQSLAANPTTPVVPAPVVQQVMPVANPAVQGAGQQVAVIPTSTPGMMMQQNLSGVMPVTAQAQVTIPVQQVASAPAASQDLEETIKNLYRQMQAAQGQTFDSATQGSFGAALVEAFNGVVELQSYMSQLLTAAQDTSLLNDAQHAYVRDTMIPNLDQVSGTTPTKSLDHAANAGPKKTLKKGKNKNKTVAGIVGKKGSAGHKAHPAALAAHGKKKKHKKAAQHAPTAADTTPVVDTTTAAA